MNKIQQHNQYLANGGSMTIAEWEMDGRYDPSAEQITTISHLLEALSEHGGKIVCTASLTVDEINQASASGRMFVDASSYGYVWIPDVELFPETAEQVQWYEKWYPLEMELPDHLKHPSFKTN